VAKERRQLKVSKDGKTGNVVLANIISSMRRGVYTKTGYKLRLVPNTKDSRTKLIHSVTDTAASAELCEKTRPAH
jgi:hypothetical protein